MVAYQGKMHGVEIHANAFATIVAARFFTDPPLMVTTIVMWLACLATGVVVARFSIVLTALGVLGTAAAYFLGSLLYANISYEEAGVAIPDLVYPPARLLLTFLCATIYRGHRRGP